MPESAAMNLTACCIVTTFLALSFVTPLGAQTPTPPPPKSPEANQLEVLMKKIDEQNAKIDALSQQILKLQQEIAKKPPGVMIGENTPESTASPSADAAAAGNTHTVARGETLTSIAKMYHVTVDELQRINHIDNPLKLQAGQTITVPTSPTPTPSSATSPSASPSP